MTIRAVILGLLGAAVLAGVTYFNDFVLRTTFMVGNYVPISVFGGLLLFVLLVNPLLGRLHRGLALRGSELAVILVLIFAACYVPGRGLMHYFTTALMMPHQHNRLNAGWRKYEVIDLAPKEMLADPSANPDKALNGFLRGLSRGSEHISLTDVPWKAWRRTLAFWVPLLLSISIALIGLVLVIHRQWSRHERLHYPIATFANALLPEEGRTVSSVFRSRGFWVAAGAVIVIHVNNYACAWFPEDLIRVPVLIDFRAAHGKLTTFVLGGGGGMLYMQFYFCAIGFGYLLAADVSMSLGIAPFLYFWVAGVAVQSGTPFGGGHLSKGVRNSLYAGAYFGMFLTLLYVGRRYYWSALRRALLIRCRDPMASHAVWGARVFLAGAILFAAQLTWAGLDWQLAAIYTVGVIAIFVVISRLVAETGAFFLHAYHYPCAVLWGFMGASALGPKMLVIMMLVSSVLLIDPREAVMPFVVNGLRIADLKNVKVGKAATWAAVSLVVALAVGIPVTLYWQYDLGVNRASDGWCTNGVGAFAFHRATTIKQDLSLVDQLAEAESVGGWGRFARISPDSETVWAFAATFGLVLLFTAGRLRFVWWPLHPVMFLVMGTYQSRTLGPSFLLGGLIKIIVTKMAGGKAYQKVKPVMFGLIAGDLLGGLIPMVVGAIYYFWTGGQNPIRFRVLPF